MLKITNIIKTMCKDSIQRDIASLLIISILIGSLAAGAVSMAANTYFSKTLASLVGDYGEYDLVIQVREEMKDDTADQVNKIVEDVFPGGKVSLGPTVTGKSYVYVTLPDQYKTKQVYENLAKTFGSIPGGASVGIMTEPRLNVRGVPEGAKNMLIERIMQMEGVRFAFRDGSTVGVILSSLDKSAAVSGNIKNIIKEYQVLEITFPVGSEPANPVRLGENIAAAMQQELRLPYAQNVSIDGKNDDMAYMVSTMLELKRFLSAYASKVTLTPAADAKLAKGDLVVFSRQPGSALQTGQASDKSNILVEVTAVLGNGQAEGRITQGDASQLGSTPGYKLEKEVIGTQAATASYQNPRQELGSALGETGKLVSQIPGFAQDAKNLSGVAAGALDNYSGSVDALAATLASLQAAGGTIQSATNALAGMDTSGIRYELDGSSRNIGSLVNSLQVVKLLDSNVGATINALAGAQQNLNNVSAGLASLDSVAVKARQAKAAIDGIAANGQTTLAALRSFDVQAAKQGLTAANSRLNGLQELNAPLLAAQIQYLAGAVPQLSDEEISHSITLLDKFIAGQVIPGARIQILTTSDIAAEAVAPVVYAQVGHQNMSLYSTALGVIEPNARGELYQVLNEVKAILAGLTAIVITMLLLGLDHTAIMTVIRRKRLAKKLPVTGWRKAAERMTIGFTAPERRYGMGVGAIMLTGMFSLSGGGIPYLPWAGVPVIGGLLGLLVAAYTEKISPVAGDEIMAGEALGLSVDEVMREIVIPAGRPGLMHKLNRRKIKFK